MKRRPTSSEVISAMSEDIKADVEWEAKMSGEEADPHPGSEKGDPDLDHVIMDSRIAVLDREVGRLRADIEGQESNNRSEILSGLSDLYERQIESFLVAAGCQRPVAAFPREYALGLGSIFVEANSFVNIIVQTQVIFCPERLVIPESIADHFVITDIKVGKNSQLVSTGSLPASVFTSRSGACRLKMDVAQISMMITVSIINTSKEGRSFQGTIFGPAWEETRRDSRR